MFSRFRGGKSKKELELEEMKRIQEELIREQMKALQMETEIEAMQKEKEIQESLVNEVVEEIAVKAEEEAEVEAAAAAAAKAEETAITEELEMENEKEREEEVEQEIQTSIEQSSQNPPQSDTTEQVGEYTVINNEDDMTFEDINKDDDGAINYSFTGSNGNKNSGEKDDEKADVLSHASSSSAVSSSDSSSSFQSHSDDDSEGSFDSYDDSERDSYDEQTTRSQQSENERNDDPTNSHPSRFGIGAGAASRVTMSMASSILSNSNSGTDYTETLQKPDETPGLPPPTHITTNNNNNNNNNNSNTISDVNQSSMESIPALLNEAFTDIGYDDSADITLFSHATSPLRKEENAEMISRDEDPTLTHDSTLTSDIIKQNDSIKSADKKSDKADISSSPPSVSEAMTTTTTMERQTSPSASVSIVTDQEHSKSLLDSFSDLDNILAQLETNDTPEIPLATNQDEEVPTRNDIREIYPSDTQFESKQEGPNFGQSEETMLINDHKASHTVQDKDSADLPTSALGEHDIVRNEEDTIGSLSEGISVNKNHDSSHNNETSSQQTSQKTEISKEKQDKNDEIKTQKSSSSSQSRIRSRRKGSGKSNKVTKTTSLLSAHLKRQKREQKKKDKRNNVTKYGDEISLGTAGLNNGKKSDKRKLSSLTYDQSKGNAPKDSQPWRETIAELKLHQRLGAAKGGNHPPEDNHVAKDKDFFEDAKEMFERSVFNFQESFASRRYEDGSLSENSEALSVIGEGEFERSDQLNESGPRDGDEGESDSGTSVGFEAEQSFSLLGFANIKSKLGEKKQDKEEEFNEKWETIEADRAVAAQMNQKRMMRLRDRAPGKEEKKDEGPVEIPRLFLFEGEKVDRRRKARRKRKERKKFKKLDNTFSKEFRKAMQEVFDSDSEDEYDGDFFAGSDEDAPKSHRMSRRGSNESTYESESHSSDSDGSDAEDNGDSIDDDEFDDDYLKRLREKSMQQEVKGMLYKHDRPAGSIASNDDSDNSDASGQQIRDRFHTTASTGSTSKFSMDSKRKNIRKNRSGEIIGANVDPAELYAKEIDKQKSRKTFTIADLRKEMEEARQEADTSKFDAFAGMAASSRADFAGVPTTPLAKKSSKLKINQSIKPTGPGVNSLRALNVGGRPTLGRETSFATHHSNDVLLGGGRKAFESNRASTFNMGGALQPTIEEDDDEAFLTGDSPNASSPTSSGGNKFRFGSAMSNFASSLVSPAMGKTKLKLGSLGGNKSTAPSNSAENDHVLGTFSSSDFPEPLPLPEMQDSVTSKRMNFALGKKFAGKMKMSVKGFGFGKRKSGSKEFGGMLDDDDDDYAMEGGLLN